MRMNFTMPAALALTLVLFACAHSPSAKPPEETSGSVAKPVATATPDSNAAGPGAISAPSADALDRGSGLVADNAGAPTEAQPALTDDQVLGVTHTANVGEVEQGKLAQAKTKDARVKKLASMMVKDHTDADAKGRALAKKANLKPEPSPTSESLEADATGATRTLRAETGADFDKGYVDTQVKEHQAVLDLVDQKLIPSATNADLKAYLAEVRTTIAMHLQHAEDLQKEMQK